MHGSDDTTSVVNLRVPMLIALLLSFEVYTGKTPGEKDHAIESSQSRTFGPQAKLSRIAQPLRCMADP